MSNLDIYVNVNMQVNLHINFNVDCNICWTGYERDICTYARADVTSQ